MNWQEGLPVFGAKPQPDTEREREFFPAIGGGSVDPRLLTIHNKPRVRLERSSNLGLTANTWTSITFDATNGTSTYDTDGFFDVSTPGLVTITTPGIYEIQLSGVFGHAGSTADGRKELLVLKNTTTIAAGTGVARDSAYVAGALVALTRNLSDVIVLQKGDKLYPYAWSDTNENLVNNDTNPWAASFRVTYQGTTP